ncbi:MAG: hypothetical protein OXG12_09530, partial [Cyanobacteria bacterium MAG COS4_bin_21]|nr:hypothetical protein [Cyanobacteria bacterium MAG COS4_bin_21]
ATHQQSGNAGALANWEKARRTLTGEPDRFTVAELEAMVARLTGTPRENWRQLLEAVKKLTSLSPELSITGGAAVVEGGKAVFTVAATPAPMVPFSVAVTVSQSGDVLASGAGGSRVVAVIKAAGTTRFEVATDNDQLDEADGSVTVTLTAGTGYTVSAARSTAAVAVCDNDDPADRESGGDAER